jgi:hypothetical protein
LTRTTPCGNVRRDGREHRARWHGGQEDHGPKLAAGTTKAIQALLGLWIALTFVLVVYALVDATRSTPVRESAPASQAR